MVRLVFIAVILVGMVISVPAGTSAFPEVSSNEKEISDVSIYPNPFKTEFKIGFSDIGNNVDIVITDILGKVILKKTVTNSNFAIINLEDQDLRPGIYIVNLKSMEQSISKRIVKK